MSDIDDLKALLGRWAVPHAEAAEVYDGRPTRAVTIAAHSAETVIGYTGFVADFRFTPAGEFISVGIWE